MSAVKVIRVMGVSEDSWEDAAREAYEEASRTVEDISGLKVVSWTADVGDDGLSEYRATVELSFPVRESS